MIIWKFPIARVDRQTVPMPEGAEILSVAKQGDAIVVWARVNPFNTPTGRTIEVIGTGNEHDKTSRRFIGTVFDGPFVWHVFERMG